VAAGDINADVGRGAASRLGEDKLLFKQTDVSKESDLASLVQATIERFGRLDILVRNAGIYPVSLIETTSAAQWERILGINLTGTFFAAKACVGPMRSSGGGRMVFTSSITGPRVAQQALWDELRIVVEPGGATAFAPLVSGRYQPAFGERVAVLLCGGNTNAVQFS
jgi:NAD(P)-dependent dehydrogenase (short-subunit alcohol dehydrogenase family)